MDYRECFPGNVEFVKIFDNLEDWKTACLADGRLHDVAGILVLLHDGLSSMN